MFNIPMHFLILIPGRRIICLPWDEIPITETVIQRVIELGMKEKVIRGLKINNSQGEIEEQYDATEDANIAGVWDQNENENENKFFTEEALAIAEEE